PSRALLSPSNRTLTPSSPKDLGSQCRRSSFKFLWRSDVSCLDSIEAPRDPAEHAPGSHFVDGSNAARLEVKHGLAPSHQARDLFHQSRLDGFRIGNRRG